jgi:hypothetical protein
MDKLIVEIWNNHLVFFHRSFLPVADFVLQDRHEEDLVFQFQINIGYNSDETLIKCFFNLSRNKLFSGEKTSAFAVRPKIASILSAPRIEMGGMHKCCPLPASINWIPKKALSIIRAIHLWPIVVGR